MTQTNVFDWRKPKPSPEEEAKQRRNKELRAEHNRKAAEKSKRLTQLSQIPMQEHFNRMDKS